MAIYLEKDILARLISIAANSSITHSLIVAEHGPVAKLLCSSPGGHGVSLSVPSPARGEVYVVMRLRETDGPHMKLVEDSIDKWNDRIGGLSYVCKFAEFKSWVASAEALLCNLSIRMFQRTIIFQNFARKQEGLFCSEVIDNIFKEAGILITPRSEYDALVGPVEFFHSPYLVLRGVIMNNEDSELIREEVRQKFDLK